MLLNFHNLKIFSGLGEALRRQSREELEGTVPPARGLRFLAKVSSPGRQILPSWEWQLVENTQKGVH